MRKIVMVVFNYYPADIRVRREAEALVGAGVSVDVICLRGDGEPSQQKVHGVNAYRINLKHSRASKFRYIRDYTYFILAAFFKLSFLHLSKRYDVVHVHNMPDILVASALFPKLTGAKVILDLHDLMPELYMTIYSMSASNAIVKYLRIFERFSIRFADLAITPNISFRNQFISRSCSPRKIHIVMNSPQESIFRTKELNENKRYLPKKPEFVIMYHGQVLERHGLDTAVKAVALLRKRTPNLAFHVYGDGEFMKTIQRQVDHLDLIGTVRFHGYVPLESIAQAIASIDVGIIPNKLSPFTNLNFPTRIFEYLSMHKPVIAPRTQGICDYFDENSLFFFEPGNVNDLAKVILKVYQDPSLGQEILDRGVNVYRKFRWELQQEHMLNLVRRLLRNSSHKQ